MKKKLLLLGSLIILAVLTSGCVTAVHEGYYEPCYRSRVIIMTEPRPFFYEHHGWHR